MAIMDASYDQYSYLAGKTNFSIGHAWYCRIGAQKALFTETTIQKEIPGKPLLGCLRPATWFIFLSFCTVCCTIIVKYHCCLVLFLSHELLKVPSEPHIMAS